jgi:hypothetical protein
MMNPDADSRRLAMPRGHASLARGEFPHPKDKPTTSYRSYTLTMAGALMLGLAPSRAGPSRLARLGAVP